jgi:hypothetical protein
MTGHAWPTEVAYMISDGQNRLKRVTWADIKADRVARQKRHLECVLQPTTPDRRAALVWTFFVPGPIYGGWHLYIRTVHDSVWLHGPEYPREIRAELALSIMQMFPCGLLPIPENFYPWKEAFARAYPYKTKRGRKPQGIVFGWVELDPDGRNPRNFQLSAGAK